MAANPARTLSIWLTAILAIGLPLAFPWLHPAEYAEPAAWSGVLLISGMIVAGKLTKSVLVGLPAALFVALHPNCLAVENADSQWALANALFWWVLVLLLAAWRLSAARSVYWKTGLALFIGLVLVHWWIWANDLLWGMVSGTLIIMGPTAAAIFGRGRGPERAAIVNRVGIWVAGLASPLLAARIVHFFCLRGQPLSNLLPSLLPWQRETAARLWTEEASRAFFGVWWWLVLFFVVWGWLRTIRRGVRDLGRNRTPAVWMVSLSAAAAALAATLKPAEGFAFLLPWCIFLLAFWVIDSLHGLGERLVLAPQELKDI